MANAGSFSGVAEGTFYAANLKNNVTISANATLCAQRSVTKHVGSSLCGCVCALLLHHYRQRPYCRYCSACGQLRSSVQPTDVATSKGCRSCNPYRRSYGTLVGEPVILVATGIGPGAAIICLAEVSTLLYISWHSSTG